MKQSEIRRSIFGKRKVLRIPMEAVLAGTVFL